MPQETALGSPCRICRFLDAPEIHRPVDVKVIDKAVDRIVEVFQKKQVAKVRGFVKKNDRSIL